MEYKFWKYQGTGNDFIVFDGREGVEGIKDNRQVIAKLCDRRFGIGADGLIILEETNDSDFKMVYYNSDGGESTMCGNGGRCAIAFAKYIGFAGLKTAFLAVDGPHTGEILSDHWVKLGMIDVSEITPLNESCYQLDTGSPHFVKILGPTEEIDIVDFGREIRYSEEYKKEGINVNSVRILPDSIEVATYERGVENETYSCGTGVTACAIAFYEHIGKTGATQIDVVTKGGNLKVSFEENNGRYTNIVLAGPAIQVFEGTINV